MSFYVYIIQSPKDGTYYKGSSTNPLKRFEEHNNGISKYTSAKLPWKLVYVEEPSSKKEMLIREKNLKRGNADYFVKLIHGNKNILHLFSWSYCPISIAEIIFFDYFLRLEKSSEILTMQKNRLCPFLM